MKFPASRPVTLLKSDSSKGVFQCIPEAYYFLRLFVFRGYLFMGMASFENFEFQNFSPKEKDR